MLVSQILTSKNDNSVCWVTPASSVSDAAALLSQKRIGTVIVSENGESPDGILSERDIVRELGKRGAGCMSDSVASMMTPKPQTCSGQDSADTVLEQMTAGRFRHLPVVEGDKMVGLISIGDVVKARLSELGMEKAALEDMVMGR